ncbi:MAG: 3-hydroxyacyl-CoA dehydrogenase NAD-binding domain-containing protein [Actinomycetia bacterium]|nr:3-hydroxyacyl-CoA dehydrogenase NAD-binding domain-containing protein [Actinomycetes bacterium]
MNRVVVVGAGQMGSGIAQVCAAAELEVVMVDVGEELLARGLAAIERSQARLAEKGGVSAEDVLGQITTSQAVPDGAADCGIEAVTEDEAAKRAVLAELDDRLPSGAIIATNTSSIPITRLSQATRRPELFIGMHFMNPVPMLPLVEVIRGLRTSDATVEATIKLAKRLGKTPVEANDFPGFIGNRILMPMINEAVFALMEGVGTAAAIDEVMKLGMRHPLGPLSLADLIGLDTCLSVMEVMHEGLGDPKYRPCPLLRQYVEAGWLGRKTGRGFYEYAE